MRISRRSFIQMDSSWGLSVAAGRAATADSYADPYHWDWLRIENAARTFVADETGPMQWPFAALDAEELRESRRKVWIH